MHFYNLTLHGVCLFSSHTQERAYRRWCATDMSTDIHINLWGAIIDNDNGFHNILQLNFGFCSEKAVEGLNCDENSA